MKKPKRAKTVRDLRAEGYRKLGITEEQARAVPRITHILGHAKLDAWQYIEGSADPLAPALLALRDKVGKACAATLPIEAFCCAAGAPTKRVLGLIVAEAFDESNTVSGLIAASRQHEVVQATVDEALKPSGTREREMVLKHSGFLPLPKTSIVNVRGNNAVVGGNQTNVAVLPPVEDTVRRMSDRFLEMVPPEPRALPAPAEVVDADEDDEEGG